MAKSYLESEANLERQNEIVRNNYNDDTPYSENHPDALSDGDPLGKGTGNDWKAPNRPHDGVGANGVVVNKNRYEYAIDTAGGGGSYDIDGRNNVGGRNRNVARNLYNPDNEYPGGLAIDETIPGQYVVKPR